MQMVGEPPIIAWAQPKPMTSIESTARIAQAMMGGSPTICIYGLPLAGIAASILYGSALLGQRMGEDQVDVLRLELERALAESDD